MHAAKPDHARMEPSQSQLEDLNCEQPEPTKRFKSNKTISHSTKNIIMYKTLGISQIQKQSMLRNTVGPAFVSPKSLASHTPCSTPGTKVSQDSINAAPPPSPHTGNIRGAAFLPSSYFWTGKHLYAKPNRHALRRPRICDHHPRHFGQLLQLGAVGVVHHQFHMMAIYHGKVNSHAIPESERCGPGFA